MRIPVFGARSRSAGLRPPGRGTTGGSVSVMRSASWPEGRKAEDPGEGGRGERGRVNKQTSVMCPRTKADRGFDIGTVVIVGGGCVFFFFTSSVAVESPEFRALAGWLAD